MSVATAGPTSRDPIELAALLAELPRPVLVATDVDGTLADIAPTPESARLRDGALDALLAIRRAGQPVAVLSGRPIRELREQFALPDDLLLVGSHGAEPGREPDRTPAEDQRLAEVTAVIEAAAATLPGARVERKPFAAALHVRRADEVAGAEALVALRRRLEEMPGLTFLAGHKVLEVSVRATSKATAMADLRRLLSPAAVVFAGDDRSDEGVFAQLGAGDVSVKVGADETVAAHRLASPADVVTMFARFAELLRG